MSCMIYNNCDVRLYSMYLNDSYQVDLDKFWTGFIVVLINDTGDCRTAHFAIRCKKYGMSIFKSRKECMHRIVFDDATHSISVVFDRRPESKTRNGIIPPREMYLELRDGIPRYMEKNGMKFMRTEIDGMLALNFDIQDHGVHVGISDPYGCKGDRETD